MFVNSFDAVNIYTTSYTSKLGFTSEINFPQYNCNNLPQTQYLQLNARGRKHILNFNLTSTWHDPLYYIVHVSFTKNKKWLREMTCGHTKKDFGG